MAVSTKSKISLVLGIVGLISNLLLLSFSGAPISIACSIMGIAFAITTIDEDRQLPKTSKTALILNIIALVFGILLFIAMAAAFSVMSDPAKSHEFISYFEQILGTFPADMQENIRAIYNL